MVVRLRDPELLAQRTEDMKALYAQGWTQERIGKKYGITKQAVGHYLKLLKLPPIHERFWDVVDMSGDCWIWTAGKTGMGYGTFNKDGRVIHAHRHAYELTYGPIPDGLILCHTCDNPACVRPQHLRAATQKENMTDRNVRNRNPLMKLHKTDVERIRSFYSRGLATQAELGRIYHVTRAAIYAIVTGKSWKHVQ